jgi:hypothetical protein
LQVSEFWEHSFPANSLQHTFNYDNPLAPLYMTGMAIPVYATPMLAMSQLGMMFQHANSIGAAFVLLVLGAGMNLGHRMLAVSRIRIQTRDCVDGSAAEHRTGSCLWTRQATVSERH